MKTSEIRRIIAALPGGKQDWERAIESIGKDLCSIDDIENEEYIRDGDGRFYSSENYVELENGEICHDDDAGICFITEEIHRREDLYEIRVVSFGRVVSEIATIDAIERNDFAEYEDTYYSREAMGYLDIVYCEDTDDYRRIGYDDVFYHNSDGAYYSYEQEEYLRGYHDGSHREVHWRDSNTDFKIGLEIEKEDEDVLQSISIGDFEDETGGDWRKERDGSLYSDGFELVSPTMPLMPDKIKEYIMSMPILVDHINASYSGRCGGHINISMTDLDGYSLFDKIKGYTPLFYAMYYGRVGKDYCKAKSNISLKIQNEKYQAIKIHRNRIEFRIISAVRNLDNLMWRINLINLLCENMTDSISEAFYNANTKLRKHLQIVYNTKEKYDSLIERYRRFAVEYENESIDNIRDLARKYSKKK